MTFMAKDVDQWMVDELKQKKFLYQETTVYSIKKKFGKDFVYTNVNGNLSIGKDVLKEFKKLSGDDVVWERGEKAWRYRASYDSAGRQQD